MTDIFHVELRRPEVLGSGGIGHDNRVLPAAALQKRKRVGALDAGSGYKLKLPILYRGLNINSLFNGQRDKVK
jgi:hypothetical protein